MLNQPKAQLKRNLFVLNQPKAQRKRDLFVLNQPKAQRKRDLFVLNQSQAQNKLGLLRRNKTRTGLLQNNDYVLQDPYKTHTGIVKANIIVFVLKHYRCILLS